MKMPNDSLIVQRQSILITAL